MQFFTTNAVVRRSWRTLAGCGLALCLSASLTRAQVLPGASLTDLSLEELGALNISAASKRAQPLFATPGAVTVLLAEDVRRSGHGSIAEAMRLVPGVHVAQQDFGNWAIGMRGFNGVSSTKLLVLVDGRTIYSPFFGGVSWSEADLHLADLARVEVVRGPGGTVWGANAVNGIVNVISRDAHETQGSLLSVRDGSTEGLDLYARSGGTLGDDAAYRVFARYTDSRHSLGPAAPDGAIDIANARVGFRVDQHADVDAHLTVQGEVSEQRNVRVNHDPAIPEEYLSDARYLRVFLLARYERRFTPDNRLTLQAYFDFQDGTARSLNVGLGRGSSGVTDDGRGFDLDLTHAVRLGERHDVVWGAGARRSVIDLTLDDTLIVQEPQTHFDTYNVFAQDEITLVPDQVRLTLGAKVEYHETIGAVTLPNLRLAWTPSERQTWWAAASRAVRAPSRSERDMRLIYGSYPATPTSPPVRVDLFADGTMEEELLDAYELGWRFRPTPGFTIDIAAYRQEYDQLRNLHARTVVQPVPFLVINEFVLVSDLEALGEGIETSIDWRLSEAWRISGHFTTQSLNVTAGVIESPLIALDLELPRYIWGVQSWWQLPEELELIVGVNGVAELESFGVPAYTRVDAQVLWHPRLDLEFALGVQNAFEDEHLEFVAGTGFGTVPVQRNFFARLSWRF